MSTENITTTAPAVVTGERTIEVITSEVIQLKADAGNAIIGIGERLIEAKEMLSHGEWLPWLTDQVEFSERSAQEFMKIAREWSNPRTLADYGKSKALKLLLLPPAEREEFIETHDVEDMSVRELQKVIRERDEAKAAAEYSEKKLDELSRAFDESQTALEDEKARTLELNTKIKELEARPIDVAVQVDEDAVKKAADDARAAAEAEWSAKVKAAEDKLAKAEEKAKKAAEKAKTAGADASKGAAAELDEARQAKANAKAEADRLRAELEAAKREQAKASISGDADLAAFQLLFEAAQENVNKMRGILLKVRGRDEALAGKLTAALTALADAVRRCAA